MLRDAYLKADALRTRRDQVSALPDPMVMGTYQPFPVLTARGTQRTQWRLTQQFQARLSAYTTGRTDFLNLLDAERMLSSLRMGHEDTY